MDRIMLIGLEVKKNYLDLLRPQPVQTLPAGEKKDELLPADEQAVRIRICDRGFSNGWLPDPVRS